MKLILLFLVVQITSLSMSYKEIETYSFDEVYVEYGNVISSNDSNGYIRIYDKETDVLLKESVYDNNGYDEFRYLSIASEESFIVVCDTYELSEHLTMPKHLESALLLYDLQGNMVKKIVLHQRPSGFYNHNYRLILDFHGSRIIYNKSLLEENEIFVAETHFGSFRYQYQGTAVINGEVVDSIDLKYPGYYEIKIKERNYQFDFQITIYPDYMITGKKYGDAYFGDVKFYSLGELLVNGHFYVIGDLIDTVGNNILLIKGLNGFELEVVITILPDIAFYDGEVQSQLIENSEFMNPLRIYSNAFSMQLNGNYYNSGLIFEPGKYQLQCFGVNGYSITIPFKIIPRVSGVENEQEYNEVTLTIFGTAKLNGQVISGTYQITKSGDYHLELLLGNEVYQSFKFTIIEPEKEIVSFDFEPILPYLFLLFVAAGAVLFFRKK